MNHDDRAHYGHPNRHRQRDRRADQGEPARLFHPRQAQDLADGDGAFLFYKKLLAAGSAGEVALGPEGEGDDVVVLGLVGLGDVEGHADVGESPSVVAGLVPGGAHGQDLGLVQGDIAQGLAGRVELDLLIVLLAFVLDHGHRLTATIIEGRRAGSTVPMHAEPHPGQWDRTPCPLSNSRLRSRGRG